MVLQMEIYNAPISSTHKHQSIRSLIAKKKWNEVITAVSVDKEQILTNGSICSPTCNKRHSALHLACLYDPPVRVLKMFTKHYPCLAHESDCLRKLPLHIACENGASREAIKVLIKENRDALMTRDYEGKIPLHSACKHYMDRTDPLISDDDAITRLENVLKTLMIACPESILEEDDEDMCAIEHAIDADLDYELVRFLQESSEEERNRLLNV